MAETPFRIAFGVLFFIYFFSRLYYAGQWRRREKVERRHDWRDRIAVRVAGWGQIPALLYILTPSMDFAHLELPVSPRIFGGLVFLFGDILLLATHWALGKNWSPYLEIRKGHTLTTHGPYRYVRHPMYASFYLMGFGMLILSSNWLVGLAFLVPFTLMYLTRVPDEERMVQDLFGDDYRAYAERTGRLLPPALTRPLRKKRVFLPLLALALAGLAPCLAVAIDGLTDELDKADVAVVLGNRVYASGEPSPSLKARLNATLRLYREGWFPEIFVSGGIGWEGHDEAKVMRQYLIDRGIPPDRIHVDNQGVNTYATAQNAAAFMRDRGMTRSLVITNYYHVPRSQTALRRAGIPAVYGAHARHFAWKDFYALPREVAAHLWYRLKSRA